MLFGVPVQWWEWLEFENITVFLVLKPNTCCAYFNYINHINSDLMYGFPLAPHYTRLSQCPLSPKLPNKQSLLDIFWPSLSVLPVSGHFHSWPQCPKLFLLQSRADFSPPRQWPRFPVSVHSHSLPYHVLAWALNSVQLLDRFTWFTTTLLCSELLASLNKALPCQRCLLSTFLSSPYLFCEVHDFIILPLVVFSGIPFFGATSLPPWQPHR